VLHVQSTERCWITLAALGPIPVCSTFDYNETFVSVGLSPYIYLTTTLYGGLYRKPCATVTDPQLPLAATTISTFNTGNDSCRVGVLCDVCINS